MFTKASTFLESMTLPSLDTMNLKMVIENTTNAHLLGFKLMLNSSFKKTFFQLLKVG
jgi:hypothetical protein